MLGFLLLFTILVVLVSDFYLLPAMRAAQHATHEQRRALKATAWLMFAVMMVILICGLILSVGLGRFFFPRRTSEPTRTHYVDAWAEAGRRAELNREFEYEDGDDADDEQDQA